MPQSRASLAIEMPGRPQASISSCLACASYTHRPSRLRLTINRPANSETHSDYWDFPRSQGM